MRKRVALATVFATGAGILIMDEPFGALDFVTRATCTTCCSTSGGAPARRSCSSRTTSMRRWCSGDRILVGRRRAIARRSGLRLAPAARRRGTLVARRGGDHEDDHPTPRISGSTPRRGVG